MPLMLTEVQRGRCSHLDYVRWSAANPAKVWGLYPRKGVIAPGADADIAIVDLDRDWTIDDAKLQSRAQDLAVARPAGEGAADPHAGARPLRDERPHAGRRTRAAGAARSTRSRRCRRRGRATPTRPWRRSSAAGAPNGERRMSDAVADASPQPPTRRHDAFVELEKVTRHLRPRRRAGPRADRDRPADRAGRLRRAGRPVRLRQVDHPQAGHRADHAPRAAMSTSAGREVGAEPVRVGMAFQNPTMLPWLTIRDNVMLPLKIVPPFRSEYRAKRKGEFRDRVEALLAQVGLAGLRRQVSLAALRRHAAARLALPRADPRSAAAAARRAVRRARPVHPRGTVGDHAGPLDDAEADRAAGHARSARRPAYLANRICVMRRGPAASSTTAWCRSRGRAPSTMTYEPEFVALTQQLRELIVACATRAAKEADAMNSRDRSAAFASGGAASSASSSLWEVICLGLRRQRHRAAAAEPDRLHAVARSCRRSGRTRCRRSTRRWSASCSASSIGVVHRRRRRLVEARLRRRLSAADRLFAASPRSRWCRSSCCGSAPAPCRRS